MTTKDRIFLIMDYIEGKSLYEILNEKTQKNIWLSQKEIHDFFITLINLLNYLHSQEIIIKDLNPKNLILTNETNINSYKLIDFGINIELVKTNILRLTENENFEHLIYLAPELLTEKIYTKV